MKLNLKRDVLMLVCFLLLSSVGLRSADCCAYIDGYLMAEATVIVWDEQTHTEHFIRRATFDDIKGNSVGFIVPTPDVPELAEAEADVLLDLGQMAKPETEIREIQNISLGSWVFPSWKITLIGGAEPMVDAAGEIDAAMPAVEILQHQRIGDLDAMTVRAADATALNQWLEKHDFSSSPELEKWLDIYIQKSWVITAFKFVGSGDSTALSSPMIRMSFKTDRPFYPYREPQTTKATGGQQLRIYLFSNGRMQSAPGQFGEKTNWPGTVEWSDDLHKHSERLQKVAPTLASQLGVSKELLQRSHWMTVFDDFSYPRPGTDDIVFIPAENKSTLPYPNIEYNKTETKIPVEAIIIAVIMVGVFIKTRRSRDSLEDS